MTHKFHLRDDERYDCEKCGGTFDDKVNTICTSESGYKDSKKIMDLVNEPIKEPAVIKSIYHKYQITYKSKEKDVKSIKTNHYLNFHVMRFKYFLKGWKIYGANK